MDFKVIINSLLESDDLKLPVLPKVATKVLELINNPNTNLNELTEIILQDQAISTHVLRIANSAAFAPATEIVSINQAISRLGFKLLTEITLAISLQSGIFNSKLFRKQMLHLWKFSLLTGLWAKRISFYKKYNVEATFLGGLLHEIGKPILLNSLNEIIANHKDYSTINNTINYGEIDIEINAKHIEIAKHVMIEWNLPKLVSTISCEYLDLDNCISHKKEATIVYLAHNLASFTFEQKEKNDAYKKELETIITLPEWGKINYYRDEVEELISETDKVLETMNSMVIL